MEHAAATVDSDGHRWPSIKGFQHLEGVSCEKRCKNIAKAFLDPKEYLKRAFQPNIIQSCFDRTIE